MLPTALWRVALVLGYPAGYTDAGFESFETPDAKVWMLTLSMVTELAALLTLGLVRPWGEVFPGGYPFSAGAGSAPWPLSCPPPSARWR